MLENGYLTLVIVQRLGNSTLTVSRALIMYNDMSLNDGKNRKIIIIIIAGFTKYILHAMALTKHLTFIVLSNPHNDSIIIIILILQMSKLKGDDGDKEQESDERICRGFDHALNLSLHLKDEGHRSGESWLHRVE